MTSPPRTGHSALLRPVRELGQALMFLFKAISRMRLNRLQLAETLRQHLGLEHDRWLFGRRWLDVKTVYIAWCHARGKEGFGGLSSSMKKLKLKFEGRAHNAAIDAWNTFRMYRALLQSNRDS